MEGNREEISVLSPAINVPHAANPAFHRWTDERQTSRGGECSQPYHGCRARSTFRPSDRLTSARTVAGAIRRQFTRAVTTVPLTIRTSARTGVTGSSIHGRPRVKDAIWCCRWKRFFAKPCAKRMNGFDPAGTIRVCGGPGIAVRGLGIGSRRPRTAAG